MSNSTDLAAKTAGDLSSRGTVAAVSAVRQDAEIYFEAAHNRYHEADNPDGALLMSLAENKLCWPLLRDKINAICAQHSAPAWTARYTERTGVPQVRQVIADFLAERMSHCPLDPENLCLTAGATSAIELAATILGDAGDVAVFPAPCYPTYTHDVGAVAQLQRYDLITHHELDEIREGPLLSPAHLDAALADIGSQGKRFRLLVLTTPDNPTGGTYSREAIEAIADWCSAHRVHLLVNEIYGLSLIDTRHPELQADYRDHRPFSSFLSLLQHRHNDYLHFCYAFSKDFGLAGFRLGLLYTRNSALTNALAHLNTTHMASNHSQWILQCILEDKNFVGALITTNQVRLTDAYLELVRVLRRCAVPYVPSRGGLFVWIDLSEFIGEQCVEVARALWLDIYRQCGLLFTPGIGYGHRKRGLFRLVYAGLSRDELAVAMTRFEKYLVDRRKL